MRSVRLRIVGIVCVAVLTTAVVAYLSAGAGARFMVRFGEGATTLKTDTFTIQDTLAVLSDGRSVPLRIYKPSAGYKRVLLVVHGVHFDGYNESRLIYLSKRLTNEGFAVVTPDFTDLKTYEIVPRTVNDISELIEFTTEHPLAAASQRDKRIGIVGISFGGGLALSAVERLHDNDKTPAFVFVFGGHGDLKRTMWFLAQGETVDGHYRKPHIYGSAVELRMFADKLVPPEDTAAFRASLLAYLEERGDDARRISAGVGPEAEKLLRAVLNENANALTPTLVSLVGQFTPDPLLSPLSAPHPPRCPVYLLHGAEDNVIPATETTALADSLRRHCKVDALVTDLIQHVELKKRTSLPPVVSFYRMSRFWTRLLRE